jgi:hypothetical protein
MNITPKRIEAIINRYHNLLDLVRTFVRETNPYQYGPYRFDEVGNIECEVNTACHCHPEYEWRVIKTKDEFSEWLNKQQQIEE